MDRLKSALVLLFVAAIYLPAANANCMLSMKLDLTYNQPLVLSSVTDSWYPLDTATAGVLHLRRDETVKLACPAPNTFATFPDKTLLQAKCISANRFEVDKKTYSFDQLQCASPVKPSTFKTGQHCISPKNELVKVGYSLGNTFVSAYEVCFDKEEKGPVYAEYVVSPDHAKNDAPVQESAWTNDATLTGTNNPEGEYTCPGQAETFYRILGKSFFSVNDKCCFAKGQLVGAKDLPYLPQQIATNHFVNSVPEWSTCNNRANWAEVERRVRRLSLNLGRPLRVWSGVARSLKLRTKWLVFTTPVYMHYASKDDKAAPVPLYIWKVVHDPQTRNSLAIITVNKPNASVAELTSYTLCTDVCRNINWMNFAQRSDVTGGFVYCCELNDFQLAFQLGSSSPFPANAGRLLRDDTSASSWP